MSQVRSPVRRLRHVAAAVALAVLAVTAGCAAGNQVTASGSPARLDEATLAETDYRQAGAANRTIQATVRATITGDVQLHGKAQVTAHLAVRRYRRTTAAGPVAVALVAAPAVRPITNKPIYRDPFATRSPVERTNLAQNASTVARLSQAGSRTVTLLGNETTLRVYEGETEAGEPVEVRLAAVRHDGDFVTVVVVSAPSADLELQALLAGVEH